MALTTLTTPAPRLKEGEIKKKEARDPVSYREGTACWELLLLAGRQLMVTPQGRNQGNKYPDLFLLPPLDFLRYPVQPGARGQGRQLGPHHSQPPRVEGEQSGPGEARDFSIEDTQHSSNETSLCSCHCSHQELYEFLEKRIYCKRHRRMPSKDILNLQNRWSRDYYKLYKNRD